MPIKLNQRELNANSQALFTRAQVEMNQTACFGCPWNFLHVINLLKVDSM